jgi:UDP-N-acetylmuramoyl-tripeptide--D-alanyl-D-alanine ligase
MPATVGSTPLPAGYRADPVRFRASEVAAAVGGRLAGPDVEVSGATVDSRSVRGGELFVPVVAARDGHEFVPDALAAGAAAYLTARPPVGGTAVVVEDTAAALTRLGAAARARLPDRVVGVTGSVGKTSVKDLLAAVLGRHFRTAASPRSFNNELGLPLTLLDAPDDAEAVVVEMGARGRGHIAALCEVARPTVGVVTTVAMAHTELFGSVEEVALAKGELVEALPPAGTAVLNAANPLVAAMASRTRAAVVRFGDGGDVVAERVTVGDDLRAAFTIVSPWGTVDVRLAARGEHQVANALAAAAAAVAAGVTLDDVAAGLGEASLSPWRMELSTARSGAVVLNDAYNANPASTAAALRSLARLPARRRVAVLGAMAELGEGSAAAHREIGELARSLGIRVVAVGAPEYGGEDVTDPAAALAALGPVGEGDAVLVKGSRVYGLERLAAAVLAG